MRETKQKPYALQKCAMLLRHNAEHIPLAQQCMQLCFWLCPFMHMHVDYICEAEMLAHTIQWQSLRSILTYAAYAELTAKVSTRIAVYAAACSRHPQILYERRTAIAIHIARTAIWQPAQCTTHKAHEL